MSNIPIVLDTIIKDLLEDILDNYNVENEIMIRWQNNLKI